ncbi:MAG: LytTR family DNA-binding domain-containing protein [Alphaproteobacteria bacterium]
MRIAIDWKRQARDVAILAGIGVFLAFLNPFGSVTDVPLTTAIPYWVSMILWGGLAGEALAWLLRKLAPKLPLWAFLGALSFLMTIVVYPALALEQDLVMHRPIHLADAPQFVFYIWLITLGVSAGVVLGFRAFGRRSGMFDPDTSPLPTMPAATPGPSPFLDRLPIRLRSSTIFAVQSEDHYLRVHTSGGEELILMRIADAIRELASLDGLQTHRSWWVAREGLADTARENGKLVLKLKSGVEAPVSRTYLQAVKAKGWI